MFVNGTQAICAVYRFNGRSSFYYGYLRFARDRIFVQIMQFQQFLVVVDFLIGLKHDQLFLLFKNKNKNVQSQKKQHDGQICLANLHDVL